MQPPKQVPSANAGMIAVDAPSQASSAGAAILQGFRKRLLILGNGRLARQLVAILASKRASRLHVIGFVDRARSSSPLGLSPELFLGPLDQLFELVERYRVDVIAVCLEDRRAALPVQTLLDLKAMGKEVADGHQLYEQEAGRLSIDSLRPSALIFSTGFKRRMLTMMLKRAIDLAVAGACLLVLSPVFLLIGLLVKLDSPGPAFYRQIRVGLGGQPYMIWKFRSMRHDAEKSGPRWAQANDPRVSRVGKWLRKTRLDELPQFINILRGEMSLVGPRPERPNFVQELRTQIPYYDIRHTVRPGMTGWAQTRFQYGASVEDAHVKLQYDLYYVKNMTLAMDFRILIETVRVVLLGEGAR